MPSRVGCGLECVKRPGHPEKQAKGPGDKGGEGARGKAESLVVAGERQGAEGR